MVYTTDSIKRKLLKGFPEPQAALITEVVYDAYQYLVKTDDFNELKAIVKELAQAQQRTELRVEELAQSQQELVQAQKETQLEMRALARAMKNTQLELGGLSRSMSYALENEAYRMIPKALKDKYGIELTEKLIRMEIRGQAINLLGRAFQNGKEVWIVGETKLRLDDRRHKGFNTILDKLEEKVRAVQSEYGTVEIVRLLITHFAGRAILKEAQNRGIIVLQSFDW